MTLLNEADALYLGSTTVDRIYVGAEMVWPEWSMPMLFSGTDGVWYDPSDFSTLFQDANGEIPVTHEGQPVGLMLDKSGNGNHAVQVTATARPILRQDQEGFFYLETDGVDDQLIGLVDHPLTSQIYYAGRLARLRTAVGQGSGIRSASSSGYNSYFYWSTLDRLSVRTYTPYYTTGLMGGASVDAPLVLEALPRNDDGFAELTNMDRVVYSTGESTWPEDFSLGTQSQVELPLSASTAPERIYGFIALWRRPDSFERDQVRNWLASREPSFTPAMFFMGGYQGAWWDPTDFSTLFQDADGTVPVTDIGQPVGRMLDKSGNGHHMIQETATARPILIYDKEGRLCLYKDGVDDFMQATGTDDWRFMHDGSPFHVVYRMATIGSLGNKTWGNKSAGANSAGLDLGARSTGTAHARRGNGSAGNASIGPAGGLPVGHVGMIEAFGEGDDVFLLLDGASNSNRATPAADVPPAREWGDTFPNGGETQFYGGFVINRSLSEPERTQLLSHMSRDLNRWTPALLFSTGVNGTWFDVNDLTTLYQDAEGTIPVTGVGQPVGFMKDKSGRDNHAIQETATARPVLQQDENGFYYLYGDGIDDFMVYGPVDNIATFAVTFMDDASSGSVGVFAIMSGNGGILRAGGTIRMYAGGATTGVPGRDGPKSVIGTIDGELSRCTIMPDDADAATALTVTGYTSGQLFRTSTSSARANGRIYGAVALDYAIAESDRSKLHAYLSSIAGVS